MVLTTNDAFAVPGEFRGCTPRGPHNAELWPGSTFCVGCEHHAMGRESAGREALSAPQFYGARPAYRQMNTCGYRYSAVSW